MIPLSKPIDLRYVMLPLGCCEFVVVDLVCVRAEFFVVCFEWPVLDETLLTWGRIAGG